MDNNGNKTDCSFRRKVQYLKNEQPTKRLTLLHVTRRLGIYSLGQKKKFNSIVVVKDSLLLSQKTSSCRAYVATII
jgi:hypothetical protein